MEPPDAPNSGTGFQPVSDNLTIKRRDLPHWQRGGATYFLTFRLARRPQPARLLTDEDQSVVKQAILFWHGKRWHVHILTVMPDHVHIIATPLEVAPDHWVSLSSILHSVKRHTARTINISRGKKGALWQSESFDRIIRDSAEYDEKANYILQNAVKAALVEDGWDYSGFWCDTMET